MTLDRMNDSEIREEILEGLVESYPEFSSNELNICADACIKTLKSCRLDRMDRRAYEIKLDWTLRLVLESAVALKQNGSLNYYSMSR